ncbi:hypothetical protein CSC70_10245 [Pseudoxanthomonas kalamensis DSM 18571]|uniref:restriction endonuclease n=1 Tax=Pseudoxanthomonas kalamensis TaxID=289483 RepID=UPI00139135C4|nr:restriction endonuclease [Pseudoxanthomonas kalamensis]KAF1710038.1 hypothetical protein CSC70_10245 [Pseudoxanthomonas kalamensis DSM 18571]
MADGNMKRQGLKQVKIRRDDGVSRLRWDRLEVLLAEHYRQQGYRVEHVGTGASGQRFDGGIDLKLRQDDQYILVQCKGWNAYQVPHNEVHQLIGLMVNEGATGAILVTTGEFTRKAIESATKLGHVQLVDGNDLREMLGPLPTDEIMRFAPGRETRNGEFGQDRVQQAGKLAAGISERMLGALEDRIRYGGRSRGRGRGHGAQALLYLAGGKLLGLVVSFGLFLLVVWVAVSVLTHGLTSITARAGKTEVPVVHEMPVQARSSSTQARAVPMSAGSRPAEPSAAPSTSKQWTPEEIRRQEQRAKEAMEIIADSTPEL